MDELINFRKTLVQLKNFTSMPVQNDRDRAGIIQAFEYTFEQCWKALQKLAGKEGVEIGSPKKAFTYALQNQMIKATDESLWLKMLEDRNLTSHTYKEDIALEVVTRISNNYIVLFEELLKNLEK